MLSVPLANPPGEFFASGSLDTCLKIWDVRRRGCVQTFRSHARGVSRVAFSPDGRWVVSGGHDGAVKARPVRDASCRHLLTDACVTSSSPCRTIQLWDLTAAKVLVEFAPHAAAVSAVECVRPCADARCVRADTSSSPCSFHPHEFLLATASADRTARVWDLETFALVTESAFLCCYARCIRR